MPTSVYVDRLNDSFVKTHHREDIRNFKQPTSGDQNCIRSTRAMIAKQLGKCSVNVDVISEPNDEGVFSYADENV